MSLVDSRTIQVASEIADLARSVSLKYFRQSLAIAQKADRSPVTIADQQAEALIGAEISRYFPDHGFYGEENGQMDTDAKWVWVVDPIDGTNGFSTGKPTFGTLIVLAMAFWHPVLLKLWLRIALSHTTICRWCR